LLHFVKRFSIVPYGANGRFSGNKAIGIVSLYKATVGSQSKKCTIGNEKMSGMT
jgi:hypothetical protein